MRAMSDVTFRDFAAAAMSGDTDRAASVLQALLDLPAEPAAAAAVHFQEQMASAGQPFMMKAMGLRTAVTEGTDSEIEKLLVECFGLDQDVARSSVAALKQRYR